MKRIFTKADKFTLNRAFDMLLESVGIPTQTYPDLFTQMFDADVISTAQTIRVAPGGSDSVGNGTASKPFATIQAALDSLQWTTIEERVIINLAPGFYDGFSLTNLSVKYANGEIPGIAIVGSMSAPVESGTIESTVRLSPTLLAITDSTKFWTVDVFQNKFLKVDGSEIYYPIVSNTNTGVAVVCDVDLTGNYQVVSPATVIGPTGPSTIYGSKTSMATIVVGDVAGQQTSTTGMDSVFVGLFNLEIAADAGTSLKAIHVKGDNGVLLKNCVVNNAGGAGATLIQATEGSLDLRSSIILPNSSQIAVGMYDIGSPMGHLSMELCLVNSFAVASQGVQASFSPSNYIGTTYIANCSTGISTKGGGLILEANTLDNCVTGLLVSSNAVVTSTGEPNTFQECSVAVSVSDTALAKLGGITGDLNTVAISIEKGGRVGVSLTADIGGTTQLTVEGIVSDIPTMLASTPQVFPSTPNAYGSYVYKE